MKPEEGLEWEQRGRTGCSLTKLGLFLLVQHFQQSDLDVRHESIDLLVRGSLKDAGEKRGTGQGGIRTGCISMFALEGEGVLSMAPWPL
jgi:hypothetical protein